MLVWPLHTRTRLLFSFAECFLHHNSHCRTAGEELVGFCSETSHPHSRSNQTTACACSSEWRLAHPRGVQRLEMWKCIIRVMDQHDHALAQGKAPWTGTATHRWLLHCSIGTHSRRGLRRGLQAPAVRPDTHQTRCAAVP